MGERITTEQARKLVATAERHGWGPLGAAVVPDLAADLIDARKRIDALRAEVGKLQRVGHDGPACVCGNRATCVGVYEGHGPVGFGCDTCCGHGNEDGWCVEVRCDR